ncbi:DUF397 domain-containing protein [Actinokineospora diospyrosa]|uniref:DUF397 domain-containing protein n=1 Tax=Actinokineospora diospyrosa TaxID=103728 RepID=UPI003555F0AD
MSLPKPVDWRKSSRCDAGKCVEVSSTGVRDSKNPRQKLDISARSRSRLVEFARTSPGMTDNPAL